MWWRIAFIKILGVALLAGGLAGGLATLINQEALRNIVWYSIGIGVGIFFLISGRKMVLTSFESCFGISRVSKDSPMWPAIQTRINEVLGQLAIDLNREFAEQEKLRQQSRDNPVMTPDSLNELADKFEAQKKRINRAKKNFYTARDSATNADFYAFVSYKPYLGGFFLRRCLPPNGDLLERILEASDDRSIDSATISKVVTNPKILDQSYLPRDEALLLLK